MGQIRQLVTNVVMIRNGLKINLLSKEEQLLSRPKHVLRGNHYYDLVIPMMTWQYQHHALSVVLTMKARQSGLLGWECTDKEEGGATSY